jgi:hypothetical protein
VGRKEIPRRIVAEVVRVVAVVIHEVDLVVAGPFGLEGYR